MKTVQSADGTTIAYDQVGGGPALILVDGALGSLALGFMEPLAAKLSPHFTVFIYDRRGRGESTDTHPFAIGREIEDIEALINEAGGEGFLYGISSGAALALEATMKLSHKVKKLALYEAPYDSDVARRQAFRTYRKQLAEVLAEGRRGDALGLFMMFVGMPPEHLEEARKLPMWMASLTFSRIAWISSGKGEIYSPIVVKSFLSFICLSPCGPPTSPHVSQLYIPISS